jgi:hypothetical protein
MRDGRAYLNFLSDFWTDVWGGSTQLSAIAGVQVEILYRLYLQSVAIAAPAYIETMPLFREDFWHVISLDSNARIGNTFTWELPLDYREIPFLYNKPFSPTLTLRPTRVASDPRDFLLTVRDGKTLITFTADPFADGAMPIRDMGTFKQIALLAPKVYTDEKDLEALFGDLVRIVRPTSEQYRQLIRGVMFVYITGGVLHLLNAGLNLAAGFPVSREIDRVIGILYVEDPNDYVIRTEKGIEYRVPKRATLSVTVGSRLTVYSTFIDDIQVMDHKSHPRWWVDLVNHIPPELSPDLRAELRDKPDVIDHIMDEYLKYTVFGLKVKTTVLQAEFNAVSEFFRVVYEVKPAWTSPYVKGFFPVTDYFTETVPWLNPDDNKIYDVPKDQVTGLPIPHPIFPQDLPRMRQTAHEAFILGAAIDLTGVAAEVWHRPLHARLNGALTTGRPIKIGAGKASLRAKEQTAHDIVSMASVFDLDERISVAGGRAVLNSRRKIGAHFQGGVIERIVIAARLELQETLDSGTWDDNVQILAVMT